MRSDGTFHLSDFGSWRGCDFRFALEVMQGEPPKSRHPATLNGTAIHRVVDWLHTEPLSEFSTESIANRYAEEFETAIEHPMREHEKGIPISWGDHLDLEHARADYASDAMAMLQGYCRDERNTGAEVVALHQKWKAEIGGSPWSGEYDQLRREPDGSLSLLDFKSGIEKPAMAPLILWEQVGYAIPVLKTHGMLPARIQRIHLRDYIPYQRAGKTKGGRTWKAGEMRGPVFYEVKITEGMLVNLVEEMKMFAESVNARKFPRRPSNYQCSRCRVQDACLKSYGADWNASAMNPSAGDYDNGEG